MAAERGEEASRPERTRLHLVVEPGRIGDFLQIFRTGVGVPVRVGGSLEERLCGRFHLDGRRMEAASLKEASRAFPGNPVALSVALPEV